MTITRKARTVSIDSIYMTFVQSRTRNKSASRTRQRSGANNGDRASSKGDSVTGCGTSEIEVWGHLLDADAMQGHDDGPIRKDGEDESVGDESQG